MTVSDSPRLTDVEVLWPFDEDADTSYLHQPEFADRYADWETGRFEFIGCQARAEIIVNGVTQIITSGGLWGIESDSTPEYRQTIEVEQLDELRAILRALGVLEIGF